MTTQDLDRQVPPLWFLPLLHIVTAGDAGHVQVPSQYCRYNDSTLYIIIEQERIIGSVGLFKYLTLQATKTTLKSIRGFSICEVLHVLCFGRGWHIIGLHFIKILCKNTENVWHLACTIFAENWLLSNLTWIWILSVFLDAPIYIHLRMVFSDVLVIDIAEDFSMESQRVQYF